MPHIRPFRALRYAPDAVGDVAAVVAPPYDILGPAERAALAARSPKNVVRLDAPADEPGDAEDDRYRRAARTLAAWRSDGTLHKDPRPAVYVQEQTYRVPGRRSSGPSAGSSPGSGSSPSTRLPASCPTSGRSPRRARTATGCSGPPVSTRAP